MAGTKLGGRKAAQTNKEKYDAIYKSEGGYYGHIGRLGGKLSKSGGFADKTVGEDGLTRAEREGAKGGRASRRTKQY